MKKISKKILGIILTLVFGYQQFSYADVIVDQPIDTFTPIAMLIGIIGVVVLVISAISFFALKATVKKQNRNEQDSEKKSTLSEEKIEKKKDRIKRRVYVWVMILSIIGFIYLSLKYEFPTDIFYIPIAIPISLFLTSVVLRSENKKKIANRMCVISIVLVWVITLWSITSNELIKNYNEQFLQYQKSENMMSPSYVSDAEGLINAVIKNNEKGKKVTLIYQNNSYTTVDELKQLLSKLNTNVNYYMKIKSNDTFGYIESIELDLEYYVNQYLAEFWDFEGEQEEGISVINLIRLAQSEIRYRGTIINITYTSETGQTTTIDVNNDVNMQDMQETKNLIEKIREGIEFNKTYKVEIKNDQSTIRACNIIIKCNN